MKTSRVSIVMTKETIEEFGVVLAAMRRDSKYALCSAGDAWRTIIAAGMQHIARVPDVDPAPVARVDVAPPDGRSISERIRGVAEKVVPIFAPEAEVETPYVQKRCPPEDVHPDMRWFAVHEEAAKKRGT